nr:uncharacterized protein LOC132432430 [Delphinus delphis]
MACAAAAAAQAEAAVGGGGGQTPTMQPGKQPWRRRRRRPRPPAPPPEPRRAAAAAAAGPALCALPELPGGGRGRRVWGEARRAVAAAPVQPRPLPPPPPPPAAPVRPTPRGRPGGLRQTPGLHEGRALFAAFISLNPLTRPVTLTKTGLNKIKKKELLQSQQMKIHW